MTSVSAGHIILTPSGWSQRDSNRGPPHQETRALPTEQPRPSEEGKERDAHGGGANDEMWRKALTVRKSIGRRQKMNKMTT